MNKIIAILLFLFLLFTSLACGIIRRSICHECSFDFACTLDGGRLLIDGYQLEDGGVLIGSQYYKPYFASLGLYIFESAYRIWAQLPHLVLLVITHLSSIVVFSWIYRRSSNAWLACFLGLSVVFDFITRGSPWGGRVDAVLLVLSALCLLEYGSHFQDWKRWLMLGIASFLSTISIFFWLTSMLFVFLLIPYTIETYVLDKKTEWRLLFTQESGRQLIRIACIAIPVFCLTVGVIAALVPYSLIDALKATPSFIASEQTWKGSLSDRVINYIKYSRFSPQIYLLPFITFVLCWRRCWIYVPFFAICMILIFKTPVYPWRMIYLLPFCLLYLYFFITEWVQKQRMIIRKSATVFLILLMLGGFWYTVARPTGLFILERELWNTEQYETQLAELNIDRIIMPHDFLDYRFYLIGRKLDWKMYRLFTSKDDFEKVLDHLKGLSKDCQPKYALLYKGHNHQNYLMQHGFELLYVINAPTKTICGKERKNYYGSIEIWKRNNL
jgi:hypothetical protein